MAGVESVNIHMDNNQVRFVARCVEDPFKLVDVMPVGFDELAEEVEGRRWDDHGPQWVNKEGKKDGFVSILTRMVNILPGGEPLWGAPCRKVEVEEVDVRPSGARGSEKNDPEAGIGGAFVFCDGSLLESGNVGAAHLW